MARINKILGPLFNKCKMIDKEEFIITTASVFPSQYVCLNALNRWFEISEINGFRFIALNRSNKHTYKISKIETRESTPDRFLFIDGYKRPIRVHVKFGEWLEYCWDSNLKYIELEIDEITTMIKK